MHKLISYDKDQMKSIKFFAVALALLCLSPTGGVQAQHKSLSDDSQSPYAKVFNIDLQDVAWTGGFWGDRFNNVYRDTMIMGVWNTLNDPNTSHAYRNFEIASGKVEGDWNGGPPFFDGDFYKWFESVATVYAITKDPKLDKFMDGIIPQIVGSQRADGYIHTPVIIREKKTGKKTEFEDRLNFETYNLGHLMTAACVHYRATGKRTLLEVGIRAADYLCDFYARSSPELARNAICPSHYMGVVEIYRTTRNPKYLELSKNLIDIRGMVENGTDDNQDRVPFREQHKAMGHSVRANYLYAGVADVYAETGDASLMECLNDIWADVTQTKMYITGACGALYDGTSPDGTSYTPDSIQKVHQSYGRSFQLPSETAHNESCANIGNLLWNWRMFDITADAKYVDIVEQVAYNSLLASISLDGKRFFYTNPLRVTEEFPYTLRWSKERQEYIWVYCCPPNITRTLTQVSAYAYAASKDGLYVNLYGSNRLSTALPSGGKVSLAQQSEYPWDGKVSMTVEEAPKAAFAMFMRIPGWCDDNVTLTVNGQAVNTPLKPGTYARIDRTWKKGDKIELNMPIRARLIESNPLVEESRGQVAVQYGPVVYCMEGLDIPKGFRLSDVKVPAGIQLKPQMTKIDGAPVMLLEGQAVATAEPSWQGTLYREVPKQGVQNVAVKFLPYYAWGNRGKTDMSVWMPLTF